MEVSANMLDTEPSKRIYNLYNSKRYSKCTVCRSAPICHEFGTEPSKKENITIIKANVIVNVGQRQYVRVRHGP